MKIWKNLKRIELYNKNKELNAKNFLKRELTTVDRFLTFYICFLIFEFFDPYLIICVTFLFSFHLNFLLWFLEISIFLLLLFAIFFYFCIFASQKRPFTPYPFGVRVQQKNLAKRHKTRAKIKKGKKKYKKKAKVAKNKNRRKK